MVSGVLPTYEFPELNRILFFTESHIDRDYMMWRLFESGVNQYEIARMVGCQQPAVNYHLLRIRALGNSADIEEYFQMAFVLNDILRDDLKHDPDRCLTNIMMTLWKNDIHSRKKLKNTSFARLKALMASSGMRRAGRIGQMALEEYRYRLKTGESTYNLYSKIIKGEPKNGNH